MAPQSDETELKSAWAAMAAQHGAPGWSSIPIGAGGGRLRAGVRHPGNAEALLVGFGQIQQPQPGQLPRGRGFAVTAIEPGTDADRPHWFVLCREPAGSRELFERMAMDIVRTVSASTASLLSLVEPVASPFWVWLGTGERPGAVTLAGGALVVGSLAARSWGRRGLVGDAA